MQAGDLLFTFYYRYSTSVLVSLAAGERPVAGIMNGYLRGCCKLIHDNIQNLEITERMWAGNV